MCFGAIYYRFAMQAIHSAPASTLLLCFGFLFLIVSGNNATVIAFAPFKLRTPHPRMIPVISLPSPTNELQVTASVDEPRCVLRSHRLFHCRGGGRRGRESRGAARLVPRAEPAVPPARAHLPREPRLAPQETQGPEPPSDSAAEPGLSVRDQDLFNRHLCLADSEPENLPRTAFVR